VKLVFADEAKTDLLQIAARLMPGHEKSAPRDLRRLPDLTLLSHHCGRGWRILHLLHGACELKEK
jgi:hypothetical protein